MNSAIWTTVHSEVNCILYHSRGTSWYAARKGRASVINKMVDRGGCNSQASAKVQIAKHARKHFSYLIYYLTDSLQRCCNNNEPKATHTCWSLNRVTNLSKSITTTKLLM